MAPSHGMHDCSPNVVRLFSDWLHHLSCARWREIFRIYRLARGGLLPDPGLARSVGVCDAAVGHFDACSGFSSPMGPAQADRALDDPNLALCVGHWSSRLFNALPMVPSAGALTAVASAVRHAVALCEGGSLADLLILAQFDMGWGQRTLQRQLGMDRPSKSCARQRFDV